MAVPTRRCSLRAPEDMRLADGAARGWREARAVRWLVAGVVVVAFAASFAFFAPLVYGMPECRRLQGPHLVSQLE